MKPDQGDVKWRALVLAVLTASSSATRDGVCILCRPTGFVYCAGLLTGSAVCGIPLNYNESNSLVTGW